MRRSFASDSRRSSNSAASAGKRPQNTTGTDGLKPGSGADAGLRSSVMVSPTSVSATALMPAVIKPISPGPSASAGRGFGVKVPTCSTWCTVPAAIMRIFMPFFSTPSMIRTRIITPR